jgi:Glycoside hydrolase family 127 C-terminal domain
VSANIAASWVEAVWLESTDNPTDLAEVRADASNGLTEAGTAGDLGDAVVLGAGDLTFIPYHTWGNRGLATMRVWVPES